MAKFIRIAGTDIDSGSIITEKRLSENACVERPEGHCFLEEGWHRVTRLSEEESDTTVDEDTLMEAIVQAIEDEECSVDRRGIDALSLTTGLKRKLKGFLEGLWFVSEEEEEAYTESGEDEGEDEDEDEDEDDDGWDEDDDDDESPGAAVAGITCSKCRAEVGLMEEHRCPTVTPTPAPRPPEDPRITAGTHVHCKCGSIVGLMEEHTCS